MLNKVWKKWKKCCHYEKIEYVKISDLLSQIDFGHAIDTWLSATYKRGSNRFCRIRNHRARLYITNYDKPEHCMDCNLIWCLILGPCWLLSSPCYKVFHIKTCCNTYTKRLPLCTTCCPVITLIAFSMNSLRAETIIKPIFIIIIICCHFYNDVWIELEWSTLFRIIWNSMQFGLYRVFCLRFGPFLHLHVSSQVSASARRWGGNLI